jgi:hypothetical protein
MKRSEGTRDAMNRSAQLGGDELCMQHLLGGKSKTLFNRLYPFVQSVQLQQHRLKHGHDVRQGRARHTGIGMRATTRAMSVLTPAWTSAMNNSLCTRVAIGTS